MCLSVTSFVSMCIYRLSVFVCDVSVILSFLIVYRVWLDGILFFLCSSVYREIRGSSIWRSSIYSVVYRGRGDSDLGGAGGPWQGLKRPLEAEP